jgi:LytS/YehU family sensor histidine kinase
MQLQPHFFFNALHTVSSLMLTDVATAQKVVAALGDIVRASFDHTARQEVPLREELAFVERYIEIQKARFRSRLHVEVEIAAVLLDAVVPSFVLQPLVENAIRHGVERRRSGGAIRIEARRSGDSLDLTVGNDGPDELTGAHDRRRLPGVGLANIEARLSQLYGDAGRFHAGPIGNGRFEVAMSIPYRVSPVVAAGRI